MAKVKSKTKKAAPKATPKKAVEKKTAPKAKKNWSVMVKKADIPVEALKLITKADVYEKQIDDAKAALEEILPSIVKSLDGSSFEHPTRGPMSIMFRGDKVYWRPKPPGRVAA